MLIKIGIAGAGAGNIMLYAVSLYAGADSLYAKYFNMLSVIFALPVLFYSATPFYKTAFNALLNKTLSIDIPISIALLMGAGFGLYNQFVGINENYFDSLTSLVFLLLLSRYFLKKIQEDGLSASDLNFFYQKESVLKKVDNQFIETHPQYLKNGDEIKIKNNEMLPVDGVIIQGHSSINNSLLTGESVPQKADIGTLVYSGTMNIEGEIIVRVEKTNQETRIGKILKEVESGWIQKAHIVTLTNKVSKYFILVVFFLAIALFVKFNFQGNTKIGLERSLTLLIVTCPCALALATPLTLSRTLSRASKKGIIIKNDEVIEKLSTVKSVYLDKTGTVTYGKLKIAIFDLLTKEAISIYEIIASLEKHSVHPVALALKEYAQQNGFSSALEVKDYKEQIGVGVSGYINDSFYEIKHGEIFKNNSLIAKFSVSDLIRPDSSAAVEVLKSYGITVSLLSGDQQKIVNNISKQIGLDPSNVYAEVTPEAKLSMMTKNEHSLMVGDGANDAMALSKAYVGVAVLGAMDISLRAADIYLSSPGITPVADLIVISKETMKVVYRNLILSLAYNCLSVYAAFTGAISPLVAAIIMPLSSLTVLFSTIIGTRKLNLHLCELKK